MAVGARDNWPSGERVTLIKSGVVSFSRGGFVRVRWDDGIVETVWGADLQPQEDGES